jgi:GNAT superfamily N-acetyltransferase
MSTHTTITTLTPDDRARWAELWTGYLAFYKTTQPPEIYDFAWKRLFDGRLHGLGARDAVGRLTGITHFLYHESAWSLTPVCYLQDLYVDPAIRGNGAGRALIEGVAAAAKAVGVTRLYWQTQSDNATARQLYDRLAVNRGFIRYDYIG